MELQIQYCSSCCCRFHIQLCLPEVKRKETGEGGEEEQEEGRYEGREGVAEAGKG